MTREELEKEVMREILKGMATSTFDYDGELARELASAVTVEIMQLLAKHEREIKQEIIHKIAWATWTSPRTIKKWMKNYDDLTNQGEDK